jgi:hypothetical protein
MASIFDSMPKTDMHGLNLDWIIGQMKNWDGDIASFAAQLEQLNQYEKSDTISMNRKLSTTGNFTGSVNGRAANALVSGVDIAGQQVRFLANQFKSGQTGQVMDGGFFTDTGINKSYNGGLF